jgi:hypothetical protein
LAVVLENYAPQGQDELPLSKFKIITVLEQHGKDGFWKGEASGKTGLFPTNVRYIKKKRQKKKKKNAFYLKFYT